jgi:ferredoxin-NADP reductase
MERRAIVGATVVPAGPAGRFVALAAGRGLTPWAESYITI